MTGETRNFRDANELLTHLAKLNAQVAEEDGRLALTAPRGVLTPHLQQELRSKKQELLNILRHRGGAQTRALPEKDATATECIHELFATQAAATPNSIAVVCGPGRLTYRDLEIRSNRLANRLRSIGIGPDTLVGVCLDRSLEMVISLLAVLKAGGAYVPLDPSFPGERLSFMLADSEVAVLITRGDLPSVAEADRTKLICLDRDWSGIEQESPDCPRGGATPGNLAYVIYTSGSTGVPKGVAIEHRSVVNFLGSMRIEPGISESDRLLAVTTLSFDIAGLEIFLPLIAGARVVIAPQSALGDGSTLARLLKDSQATMMQATPVTWRLLLDSGWDGLPRIKMLCGGEALSGELANRLLATGGVLWNLYGPTETTIWSTVHRVAPGDRVVSIGMPIANTQVHILNEDRKPAPPGIAGELYIGGDGVAREYWKQPELTAKRFLPDPFRPGNRMYRTGDLVRRLSDGTLEHLGRNDRQIKLRGFRIEPGEIEAALERLPGVRQAVVELREDDPGDPRLTAYIVSDPPGDAAAMREALALGLPGHMVPSAFVFLNAIPLTPNRKVDRKALPAPPVPSAAASIATSPDACGTDGTVNRLGAIWRALLKMPEIGMHDDFFALGGHSLLIVQLQSRIRQQFSQELSIPELFQRPTIAALAELLDANRNGGLSATGGSGVPQAATDAAAPVELVPISRVPRDVALPLSSGQLRLWFLDQLSPRSAAYILPMAARVRGRLDCAALERALFEIVRRHEVLRTVFPVSNGLPGQTILAAAPVPLDMVDLSGYPLVERERRAREAVDAAAREPFDLSRGPLFRARLVRLGEEECALVIAVHHIVFDAWSMEVFWREFASLYAVFRDGGQSPLPELPIQFADFASWQRRSFEGEAREKHLSYWKAQLGGTLPVLDLPADKPRQILRNSRAAQKAVDLSPALSGRLKSLSQTENASLFMTLLAALNVLLHRLSGQDDILVGTPVAGRNRVELENLIGFFINTVVVRTRLSGSLRFLDLLSRIRSTVLDALSHQEMPFEELVEALDSERDLTRTPLFQVFLNQLNGQLTPVRIPGLTLEPFHRFELEAKFDLTFYVAEWEDAIHLVLVYNADLFDEERMGILLEQYGRVLEQVCDNPGLAIDEYSLLTESGRGRVPDPATPLQLQWAGPVHSRFVTQAAVSPRRTAIEEDGARWTYGRLAALTGGLAAWLRTHGVSPGDTVAIYGHRSGPQVLAVLGVLRAGAAFCILDPAYPAARLAACVRTVKPKAWLRIAAAGGPPPELEAALETACRLTLPRAPGIFSMPELAGKDDHSCEVDPDSPAYLTFTSGTTGEPKCVLGTHRPLAHFEDWHVRQFGLKRHDRFSMLSGLGHDPLLRDIFTPLCLGATLVISSDDIFSPGRLSRWIRQRHITIAHLTPAMVQLIAEPSTSPPQPLPTLRYAFFGGDLLTGREVALITSMAPQVECVNFYGTTETPQAMTWFRVPKIPPAGDTAPARPIPLGRPVPDAQVLIMNRNGVLAGIGELGEIYIRTPYLSRGYINDDTLTRKRFLANPFTGDGGDRLYRTGDLARFRPDGAVEFAGRADHQIKIRGYRIELGEIEAALAKCPHVQRGVVVARNNRSGGKRLVACLIPQNGGRLMPEQVRARLKELLPAYMIPSAFVAVDSIPLTPNAKVDRDALTIPEAVLAGTAHEYVAARNAVEKAMADIWCDVLGVGEVGILDNFFDLGGHSLSATRLIARLRDAFELDLPLQCIFLEPTIAGLAKHIRYDAVAKSYRYDGEPQRRTCLVPVQPRGTRTPLVLVAGYQNPDDTLMELSRLIPHLGSDRPVYGFKPRWVDGDREVCGSVEEDAREYLAELRAVQPNGPYLLGGSCLSGIVALEMARQLMQAGERVGLLALIDTVRPTPIRTFVTDAWHGCLAAKHVAEVVFEAVRWDNRPRSDAALDLIRRKVRSLLRRNETTPAQAFYRLKRRYVRVCHEYAATEYPGRITLIVNEKTYRVDKYLGWRGFPAELVIKKTPGRHDTIFVEHGKELAGLLLESIEEAMPESHLGEARAQVSVS